VADDEPEGIDTLVTLEPPEEVANTTVPDEFDERKTVVEKNEAVVGLPYASCSCTVMGPMVALDDAVPLRGFEMMANWEAEPTVMLNGLEVATAIVPSVAVRV
jgi:hypothetical protein